MSKDILGNELAVGDQILCCGLKNTLRGNRTIKFPRLRKGVVQEVNHNSVVAVLYDDAVTVVSRREQVVKL